MISYNKKNEDITARILVGGKSSRMGFDKSLIEYKGKPIIKIIFDILETQFKNIIIISNESEKYLFLNTPIKNFFINKGPLAGIHSALSNSKTNKNFIISCDLPFINSELIKHIISYETDKQIAIPIYHNKSQPLCGIYKKGISPILTNYIINNMNKNNKKLLSINSFLKTTEFDFIELNDLSINVSNILFNLNDKNDLKKLLNSN